MEPDHVVETCYATTTEQPAALQHYVTQALVQEIRDNPNSHLTYETMVVRILKRLAEEGFGLSWDRGILETTRHVYMPPALHALLERMWRERASAATKPSVVTLEEQHCIERILGRDYVRQTDLVKLAGCVHKFARDEKDVWMLFAVDGLLGQDPKRYVDALRCDDEGPKAKHVRLVRKWYREERVEHPGEMKEILEDVFRQGLAASDWRQKEYIEAVGGTEEAVKQIMEWVESRKKKAEGETSRKRSKTTTAVAEEISRHFAVCVTFLLVSEVIFVMQMLEVSRHPESIEEYCCDLKCFKAPREQVDGLACRDCHSFGYCRCLCSTLMRKPYNYCCSKRCSKMGFEICILCRYGCYCLCDFRNDILVERPGVVTARINGKLVETVEYRGERKYCCEKRCIPVPTWVVRGLACRKCKAVNYCKCECPTWMQRYKEAIEQLMEEFQFSEQQYFYNFI